MNKRLIQNSFQVLRDSIAYSFSKVIPGITGLISVVLFFRLVGAEEYGRYSILFAYLSILTAFCYGWMSQSVLRYYSRFNRTDGFGKMMVKGSLISSLVSVVLISLLHQLDFPEQSAFIPQAFLGISIGLFTLNLVFFQAKQRPRMVIKLTAIQSVMGIIFPLGFIFLLRTSHMSILWGLSLAYLIPSLYYLYHRIGRIKTSVLNRNSNENQPQLLKIFFSYGWPLSFWFVSSLSLQFLDRFFIEKYYGLGMMGSYAGFSELVTRIFSVILFPVTLAIHPKVMELWNSRKLKLSMEFIGIGLAFQLGIFLLCFLGFYLFRPQLFNLILKLVPQLDTSLISVLIPVLTGGFLWHIALLVHKPLELNERSRLMQLIIVISVGINIFGNTIFLPQYGVIATAYTTIVSASVYIIFSIISSRKLVYKAMKA